MGSAATSSAPMYSPSRTDATAPTAHAAIAAALMIFRTVCMSGHCPVLRCVHLLLRPVATARERPRPCLVGVFAGSCHSNGLFERVFFAPATARVTFAAVSGAARHEDVGDVHSVADVDFEPASHVVLFEMFGKDFAGCLSLFVAV